MIKFLFFPFLLLLSMEYTAAEQDCPIELPCNNTHFNDSKVEEYCSNATMISRCCISNETIIGLDLRYCEIKRLNISSSNFSELIILDIRDNEFEEFTSKDLIGLLKLEFLYLPEHIMCPGGDDAWESHSFEDNMTSCCHQLNPCIYLNISCTDNGMCIHTGPGTAKCICKPGHHGYKCLNEGKFPTAIFSSSIVISTVVLCIIMWFVQGREAHRKS